MNWIDIHCHLLPGIDDGPDTLEETVALLRTAWAGGTRALVATPHLYADFFPAADLPTIRETFAATVGELGRLAARPGCEFLGELELFLGAEHYCDGPFLAALEKGEVQPIHTGRCLLVEFPMQLPAASVHTACRRILDAGYRPVLAHVERYYFVLERPARLAPLVEMGCLVQVNADGSRRFGVSPRHVRALLASGLVHVLATDAHHAEWRPPDLGPLTRPLRENFPETTVDAWVRDNPGRIVSSAGSERRRAEDASVGATAAPTHLATR